MDRMLNRLAHAAAAATTDSDLLDGFLAHRSEPAFESLVRRHGPMVLAVCRRVLRHRQDAEDAFQATFLILARRAADVWPRDAVGSWLYGVAHRVALKARSVRSRRLTREQPLNENPAVSVELPPPDLAEVIDRAVRKLPEVYRAAVVACDLEGLSRKAAAEQLGWKEGTLSGRLARARQLLASRLRKAGLTLPAGGVGTALGTGDVLSADLVANTVRTAIGSSGGNLAAGVSAPVAALTEGVVRGMFLTKIQAAVVAVLAVGMLGVGVWASSGTGGQTGNGASAKPGPSPSEAAAVVADPSGAQPAPKLPPELEPFQGEWWILAKGEGDKFERFDPNTARDPRQFVVRFQGHLFNPPYPGPTKELAFLDRQMKVAIDATKSPRQLDLVHDAGRLTGIYAFPTAGPKDELILLRLVFTTQGERPAAFEPRPAGAVELILGRYADPKRDPGSNAGLGPREMPPDLRAAEERLQIAHQELELAVHVIKQRLPVRDLDEFELRLQQDKMRVDAARQLIEQAEGEVVKARLKVKPAPRLPAGQPKGGAPKPEVPKAEAELPGKTAPAPRLELTLQELDILGQELDILASKGKLTPADVERLKARIGAAQTLLAPGKELLKTPSNTPGMAEELKRLQGKWRITSRLYNNVLQKLSPATDDPRLLVVEIRGDKLRMPYLDDSDKLQHSESTIWRLDASKSPNEIDLIHPNHIVERAIYQIKTEAGRTTLILTGGRDGRPRAIGAPGEGGVELTLVRVDDDQKPEPKPKPEVKDTNPDAKAREAERQKAAQAVAVARENYVQAKAAEEAAHVEAVVAQRRLDIAKAKLAQAEKALADLNVKPRMEYTIRIRPLDGPEQVKTLPLTGSVTVLDALTGPLHLEAKDPPPLEVWVLRPQPGKPTEPELLTVDWPGIRRGETKTNYQLRDGDTIVVQSRLKR